MRAKKFSPGDEVRYIPCPRCGDRITRHSDNEICSHCQKISEHRSPHTGRRHGLVVRYSGDVARCKMPRCRRVFKLRDYQDVRYTWYCPECRRQIAVITTGVLWLRGLGIEIFVGDDGEDILLDSTVKAYDMAEEDQDETIIRQKGEQLRGQAGEAERPVHEGVPPTGT